MSTRGAEEHRHERRVRGVREEYEHERSVTMKGARAQEDREGGARRV